MLDLYLFNVGRLNMLNESNIFYVQGGNKTPAPDIQINDEFELVLSCALRYALGRMTYVPSDITGYIKPLLPYLTEPTIKVFKRDIYEQSKYEKGLGIDCDKQVWMDFYDACDNELIRRTEGSNKE